MVMLETNQNEDQQNQTRIKGRCLTLKLICETEMNHFFNTRGRNVSFT